MHRLRRHLSYANVAATLALIIAIAGGTTAIAGNKIGAQDLKKIKVRTNQVIGPIDSPVAAKAECKPGEKLTGGGGRGEIRDYPSGNGWTSEGTGAAVAYALCLTR